MIMIFDENSISSKAARIRSSFATAKKHGGIVNWNLEGKKIYIVIVEEGHRYMIIAEKDNGIQTEIICFIKERGVGMTIIEREATEKVTVIGSFIGQRAAEELLFIMGKRKVLIN